MSNYTIREMPLFQENIDIPLTYTHDASTWDHDYPTTSSMTQHGLIRLRVVLSQSLANDLNPQHNGLWLRMFDSDTIGGTIVSAGSAIADDVNKGRGWYTESVKLDASVSGPGVMFQGSQPNTRNQSGTVSSSSGFNGNAGLFGDNVQAGVGFSESTSVSYNYTAVTFDNQSTTQLEHLYRMTGTVDDHSDSYSGPSDMYWRETDAIFHHAEMRTPPAECFNPGNLPIISQGLWTVPETFEGTIELKLTFTIRFVIALQHDTNAVGDSDTRWWWHDQVVERTLKIDWATGKIINADAQEVADWLKIEKNSGASVVAMAHKLAGAPLQQWAWAQGRGNYFGCPVDPTSAPYDHYDFANCYNFLQRFPQYAGDLSSLSGLSGAWRKLVANWSAISKAYAAGQMSTVDSMVAAAHD